MGVDAEILFEVTGDISDLYLGSDFKITEADEFDKEDHPGATHSASTCIRYYGPGYERGTWPTICTCLMNLHAHENVGKVWYGGDSTNQHPECPPERVNEISLHFMTHGNRPYNNAFKR